MTYPSNKTTWEGVGDWYADLVGAKGHYFHQQVIMPRLMELCGFDSRNVGDSRVLDLACGQGVLSSYLPPNLEYVGVDGAPKLIAAAKGRDGNKKHQYFVADVSKSLSLEGKFSDIFCILALQNIKDGGGVFANVKPFLKNGSRVFLVINHPYFRIPRQTSWEIDEKQKMQYRRVNRYLTPLEIPVKASPSLGEKSQLTWSYHFSLQTLFEWLRIANLTVCNIEEWVSPKVSQGKAAKMENRSRLEFPMFMMIEAKYFDHEK